MNDRQNIEDKMIKGQIESTTRQQCLNQLHGLQSPEGEVDDEGSQESQEGEAVACSGRVGLGWEGS